MKLISKINTIIENIENNRKSLDILMNSSSSYDDIYIIYGKNH